MKLPACLPPSFAQSTWRYVYRFIMIVFCRRKRSSIQRTLARERDHHARDLHAFSARVRASARLDAANALPPRREGVWLFDLRTRQLASWQASRSLASASECARGL